jgi:hypothetical protein
MGNVFHNTSVKGFFESLGPLRILLTLPTDTLNRQNILLTILETRRALWTDANAWDAPIFYLAFHGSPGAVETVLERIDSQERCEAFRDYGDYPCLIYVGSCSVLAGPLGEAFGNDLLKTSGARAVIGYTTNVDWMNSLVVDMLFLYRFSHMGIRGHLAGIFESVRKDFSPARDGLHTVVADNGQRP